MTHHTIQVEDKLHTMPGDEVDLHLQLIHLLNYLVSELSEYHPYAQPGLWDMTVDRIRAVRLTIKTQQARVIKEATHAR